MQPKHDVSGLCDARSWDKVKILECFLYSYVSVQHSFVFFYSANYFAYSTFIDRFWDHRNEGVELCCSQWLTVRCFIMAHCIWILQCMNFQRATERKSSSLQQCKESLKPCNTVICAQEQVEIATSIFKRCFWKLILHTKHNLPK